MVKIYSFHAFFLVIAASTTPAAASSWLCVSESTAGFIQSEQNGKPVSQAYRGARNYLVRPPLPTDVLPDDRPDLKYLVVSIDQPELKPIAFFYEDIEGGRPRYRSEVGIADFAISPKNNRFVVMSYFDYIAGREVDPIQIAFMEIGNCSQVN